MAGKRPPRRDLKRDLKRLLNRNKVVSYAVVGFVGVLFIALCLIFPIESFQHEVGIGLGTGLITDVVIMVLLWALVPDYSEQEENLSDWGLVDVFRERRTVKAVSREHLPKHDLDIAAYGLKHLRDDVDTTKLAKRVRGGLTIRVLIPRPHSLDVDARQELEENANLSADLESLIVWLQEIEKFADANADGCRGQISYKIYEGAQLDFYLRCDDDICWSVHA